MEPGSITSAFASIPTDWIIIAAVVLVAAFTTVRSGSERICALALALPAAVLLLGLLPQTFILSGIVSGLSTALLQAILFVVLLIAMYLLVLRIGLSYGGGAGQALQAALIGVAAAAILVVFWVQSPALGSIWTFGPSIQSVFGEEYAFWWLLASYATLGFVRR